MAKCLLTMAFRVSNPLFYFLLALSLASGCATGTSLLTKNPSLSSSPPSQRTPHHNLNLHSERLATNRRVHKNSSTRHRRNVLHHPSRCIRPRHLVRNGRRNARDNPAASEFTGSTPTTSKGPPAEGIPIATV